MDHSKGFTLIETIVTLGIVIMLFTLTTFISMDFFRGYDYRSEGAIVVSLLEKARNQSMNNVNGAGHGVFFDSGNYILFEGPSYAGRNTVKDTVIAMGNGTVHSGLSEIVFEQLSGNTAAGTVTITKSGQNFNITLNNEGRINW